MSIQSTVFVTREEAEQKALVKLLEEKYTKIARSEIVMLSRNDLEDLIDEQFYNYTITNE